MSLPHSRSVSSSSSSSPQYHGGADVGREAISPRFELTAVVHELEEPLLSMDCQSDVMALLGERGRLVVRDTLKDGLPITAVIRNPHRVFLDPMGNHALVAASDGEMYYFSTRHRRTTGHFMLQHSGEVRDGLPRTLLMSNNVAECVCWLPTKGAASVAKPTTTTASSSSSLSTAATATMPTAVHFLVGTKLGGFVFEVRLELSTEGGGGIKSTCRQCLQLPAGSFQSPVASVQVERVNALWVIFVSTPTRLYRIEGEAASPTALLEKAAANPDLFHLREELGEPSSSARGVVVLYRPGVKMMAQSYAWASASGVVHGLLNRRVDEGLCSSEAAILQWNDTTAVINEQLIALPKVKQLEPATSGVGGGGGVSLHGSNAFPFGKVPMEVALMGFHMVFLYSDRLIVLNHPAGLTWRGASSTLHGDLPFDCEIEERVRFDLFRATRKTPELRGVVRDTAARKMYIFGKNLVWELQVEQEHRQQWRLFLDRAMNVSEVVLLRKRFFQAAHQLCKYNARAKSIVQLLRGNFLLRIGAVRHATDVLADCNSFDAVYHLLVSLHNSKVLRWYVEKRYKLLVNYASDKWAMQTQFACLFTLIVVLRLDCITRSEHDVEKYTEAISSFTTFMKEAIAKQPHLFQHTVYSELIAQLLEGQGRPELALSYAEQMNKLHYIVMHHVSRGAYVQAANVLSTHARRNDILETWYEFAPILMKKCPIRFTTAMLRAVGRDAQGTTFMLLQLERLIPVFTQYTPEVNEDQSNKEHQVILFLEHSIAKFDCVSTVVHNYYLSLLAQYDGERLERFFESSLFYSIDFALRRCLEARRFRQCIGLYHRLHLHEDAIRTALDCSASKESTGLEDGDEEGEWPALHAAKELLKSLPDSMGPAKQKRLWLIVAQYAMERNKSRAALSIVADSGDILKLEDILDNMGDSRVVRNFKDAICKSLDAYAASITALKEQQLDASRISDVLKEEISQLQHRFGYVTPRQRCMLCHHALLQDSVPYLIYPNCRHAVHEACAVSKLTEIGGVEVFFTDEGLPRHFLDGVTSTSDLAQMECVLCAEVAILEIDIPLFLEDDSWSVA